MTPDDDANVASFHEHRSPPDGTFDPKAIVAACIESGAMGLLIDEDGFPAEFFDLSTGIAGDLLHRLTLYRVPMAAVVRETDRLSTAFQAFMREANSGRQFRFCADRAEAIAWLEANASG